MTAIQNPELTKVLTQTRSEQLEQLDKTRRGRAALEREVEAARQQEAALELVIRALNGALFPVEGLLQPLTRPIPLISTTELLRWVEAAPKNSQLAIVEKPDMTRKSVLAQIEEVSPLSTPREWAGRRSIIRADNELIASAYSSVARLMEEAFIDNLDLLVIALSTADPAIVGKSTDMLTSRLAPQTVIAFLADA